MLQIHCRLVHNFFNLILLPVEVLEDDEVKTIRKAAETYKEVNLDK